MAGRTFAAIVIGSTETEMKVFEFETRKGIREIDWVSRRLNLGLDAYTLGRISQENINDLCETLRDFKRIMEGYKAENYRVCATSAFRASRNMSIIRDYIEKQTGLTIEVISNSEQRFFDYKAIASVTEEFEQIIQNPAAIVDIGGNSIQISLFDNDKLITTQNIRMGNVSTREKMAPLLKNTEHFRRLVEELLGHELEGFNKLYQKDRQIKNLIVVGGNLAELIHSLEKNGKQIPSVSAQQFQKIYDQVFLLEPDEIALKFDIAPEKTSVIMPSAVFCKCMMEHFGVETVWLPGFSLADGLAYDYGEKKKYIRCVHSFEEDIIAAARNISKRYKGEPAHVKNLEAIGLKVFDKMKKIHGLGKRERLLLQISIILHNCGKYISLENVSECAYNIIMATEIIGLSHTEREMIAHTVKLNTSPFVYFSQLPGNVGLTEEQYLTVAKMTAILRIINALDRTHRQKCKNPEISLKDNELRIVVESQEDLTLEAGTFREKADFFEEVFNVRPVFRQKRKF